MRDSQGRVINAEALQEEMATAIGDGVAVAVDRLRGAKAKSKVLVLLDRRRQQRRGRRPSRGGRNCGGLGNPRVHDRHRAQRHGPIPQEDEFGNKVLVPAQFRIDEELLQEMAQAGRGRYFHASDSEGLPRFMPRSTSWKNRSSRKRSIRNILSCSRGSRHRAWRSFCWSACYAETRFRSLP